MRRSLEAERGQILFGHRGLLFCVYCTNIQYFAQLPIQPAGRRASDESR
ncbi:hypothetical protein BURPS1655_B0106 [Burkholderia pseudomallei 1655]|nr:hypothetical protein BURPS1655_B0106 [Burkholderia pseudomallei 1655]